MKRLSRSLITVLLVALVAFALISCATTAKVEVMEPVAPIVEPVTPPAPPVAAEPEVVKPVEEVPTPELPVFIAEEVEGRALPEEVIVKSDDRFTEFDLYIAHTNDALGALDDGIGYARLATGVNFGRSLTDKTLLLDAGNVASGSAEVEKFAGEPAAMLLDMLGYDAVAPGPADFAYGAEYLIEASRLSEGLTDLKVLSANVLNPRGEWVFQPYQLYSFNGFVVAVAGLSAPPANTQGLTFLSSDVVANAQYAVDQIRQVADFVVLLGNIGNVDGITSEVIAQNINGIDLIIDGEQANAPAGGKRVGSTVIVNATKKLSSVGVVEVHVVGNKATAITPIRISASDVNAPERSELARWAGIEYVPADSDVAAYISGVKAEYAKVTAVPVEVAKPAEPAVVAPVVPSSKDFKFYVVHTNDVHGRIEADEGVGYAKLATLLKMGREVTDKYLVLDAGDVSHGTLLTNLFEGETSAVLLDMLGYNAVVPGNHDFNYGKERLIEAAQLAQQYSNLRVLAANVLDENGNMVFQPYQIYDFDGFKVGVIGATTPDTLTKTHPKNVQGLSFMSDEVIYGAQALVDEVRRQSDFVILLAHLGLDEDGSYGITSRFVAQNLNGIDLIVDGHSHTVLENGLQVGNTLIVSTGEYMKNIGVVEVDVLNDKVVGQHAFLIPASEILDPSTSDLAKSVGITSVPDDPEVVAYINSQKSQLEDLTKEVVAYTPIRLEGERELARTRPTNLGTMIAQAMIEATGADVALTNGGGIRASIAAGDVTRGDIITVLPFNNTVAMIEVTGQELYDAIEWGYSVLPETNGGFPQTANLSIVYSRFSEPGNRIKRLLVGGKAVDRNATYKLATNDFMAAGGDGYTMLDKPIVMYGRGLDEVLTDYMVKHNKR
ncbi:MAG: 5'-nucleotidase C-terminal domain-containing protein [Sphaerochaetaceae bacterium]